MKKKATGVQEWASHSINIQRGCSAGCLYCFASANAYRFKKVKPGEWVNPVINNPVLTHKMEQKLDGVIMFPTAHDITRQNWPQCLEALRSMLFAGNSVLIVTKPNLESIKGICADGLFRSFKERVLWRFTIGTDNEADLKYWEPGAPSFRERLKCLEYAWADGWKTSISCEPLLTMSIDQTIGMVNLLRAFVTDHIWLGRANHLKQRVSLNCPGRDLYTAATLLEGAWSDNTIKFLYNRLKDDPLIKWKNSVKEVVGLSLNERAGMDK
jgi:DNA repair photolyase